MYLVNHLGKEMLWREPINTAFNPLSIWLIVGKISLGLIQYFSAQRDTFIPTEIKIYTNRFYENRADEFRAIH